MEKLLEIKREIQEKKGKEWLGMQPSTVKHLDHFMWYLDHPQLHDDAILAEEIIELYYLAKATSFIKMEGIIRKLDQLSVTLGKAESVEKKAVIRAMGIEINELREKVENLLASPAGASLPDSNLKSLRTFVNFLNHPKLPKKPELFEKMLERYKDVEDNNFISFQSFNDLLNVADIKLGAVPVEIKEEKLEAKETIAQGEGPICNECSNVNRITAKYCDNCGTQL